MEEQTTPAVVIANKVVHRGRLFGSISNGCPCLVLSDGIALKIVADKSDFVTIQVLHYGCGVSPKNQSWVKSKKVIVKKEVTVKPKKPVGTKIETKQELEQTDLFEDI